MVASLLNLLHSGLQDERLEPAKGNPSLAAITTAYVRAGRFTTEWYRVEFDTRPGFGLTARATLPRRGHLITRLYLVTTMPDIATPQQQAISTVAAFSNGATYAGPYIGWTNGLGHALVTDMSLDIAGTAVSRLDGRLLELLDEFRTPLEKVPTVNRLIARTDSGFSATTFGFSTAGGQPTQTVTPLRFWFADGDSAAALPIDAIAKDPVQVNITFNTLDRLFVSSDQSTGAIQALSTVSTLTTTGLSSFATRSEACGQSIAGQEFRFYSTVTGSSIVFNGSSIFTIPGASFPQTQFLTMGDCYLLAEYVYVDSPEANRLRLGDLTIPMIQYYRQVPFDTNGLSQIRIPLQIPNPTRNLFFYAHRPEADALNAPFLATRDLTAPQDTKLWWPDARGLSTVRYTGVLPAYATADSEPLNTCALLYEGKLVRYATDSPALFRSILPSLEQVKSPWFHKYYYNMSFGTQDGLFGPTTHMGEANLDKVQRVELQLSFNPARGSMDPTNCPRYTIYTWAETYNLLRIYGGRAGLLFAY